MISASAPYVDAEAFLREHGRAVPPRKSPPGSAAPVEVSQVSREPAVHPSPVVTPTRGPLCDAGYRIERDPDLEHPNLTKLSPAYEPTCGVTDREVADGVLERALAAMDEHLHREWPSALAPIGPRQQRSQRPQPVRVCTADATGRHPSAHCPVHGYLGGD